MAAVAILSHEDCLEILQRWKQDGPTKEEKDEFTLTALAQLNDHNEVKLIQEDISQAAEMAESIDNIFSEVRNQLWILSRFWAPYYDLFIQWASYQQRWRQCLRRSCDVAAKNIDILRRFDNVYLEKLENIQTEQDRIEAIEALEPFIAELETDQSVAMTQEFLTLQRDVEVFIDRFNTTVPGIGLNSRKEIGVLDEQIESAQDALGITRGSLLDILGLGARASSIVASLKAQRNKKAENLRELHLAIKALNKLQAPQPQSEFAGYQVEEPGIKELLKYLGIFTKIWASVRSYTVQFREHLKGGLEASTNTVRLYTDLMGWFRYDLLQRFKAEVKAARSVCTPLMESLAAYIADLERWI